MSKEKITCRECGKTGTNLEDFISVPKDGFSKEVTYICNDCVEKDMNSNLKKYKDLKK